MDENKMKWDAIKKSKCSATFLSALFATCAMRVCCLFYHHDSRFRPQTTQSTGKDMHAICVFLTACDGQFDIFNGICKSICLCLFLTKPALRICIIEDGFGHLCLLCIIYSAHFCQKMEGDKLSLLVHITSICFFFEWIKNVWFEP